MDKLQDVQAFIIDVEENLKLRDTYYKQIRQLEAEVELISRASLPQFEQVPLSKRAVWASFSQMSTFVPLKVVF
jgi:hypothetical protein